MKERGIVMIIKGDMVQVTALVKMSIKDDVKWQLANLKMYCSLFSGKAIAGDKFYYSTRINDIEEELVKHFGFSWEQMEKCEVEYSK